jgi:hypothetical protein
MIATLVTVALAASCHTVGHAPFTAPDNALACTPGSTVHLTWQQACTPTDRSTTPVAVRRKVLAEYGVPNWTGADGEIDHRVPWFLSHDSSAGNLWPERGPATNNPKDALEGYVWRRVCVKRTMRVRTARREFLGDWRAYYRWYVKRHEIKPQAEGS